MSFLFPSLPLAARLLFTGASVAAGILVLAFETSLRRTLESHGGFVVTHRRKVAPVAAATLLTCLGVASYLTIAPTGPGQQRLLTEGPQRGATSGKEYGGGRVFIPNDDGDLTVVTSEGQTSTISVGMNPQTPTVAPEGTPNQGTVYVPQLAGDAHAFMTAIRPNGAQRTIDVCQGPLRPIVAPSRTPNAGTVYVPCAVNDGRGFMTIVDTSNRAHTIQVGDGPSGGVAAPAGAQNAGVVYVSNTEDGTVSVLNPGSTRPHTLHVGGHPQTGAVAPEGTPNAGTVYVPNANGTLQIISPTSRVRDIVVGGGGDPLPPVVAPAGASNAGTVYIVQRSSLVVDVIRPNGEVATVQLNAQGRFAQNLYDPSVAPAGLRTAGTVYIPDHGFDAEGYTVFTISPDGSIGKLSVGLVPQTPVIAPQSAPNAGNIYIPCSEESELWIVKPSGSISHIGLGSHPGKPAIG